MSFGEIFGSSDFIVAEGSAKILVYTQSLLEKLTKVKVCLYFWVVFSQNLYK